MPTNEGVLHSLEYQLSEMPKIFETRPTPTWTNIFHGSAFQQLHCEKQHRDNLLTPSDLMIIAKWKQLKVIISRSLRWQSWRSYTTYHYWATWRFWGICGEWINNSSGEDQVGDDIHENYLMCQVMKLDNR